MEEDIKFIIALLNTHIKDNGTDQHRLLLEDGYHTGPAVDWIHQFLTVLKSYLEQSLENNKNG